MRVIFAGTPEFARIALERIHAAGHEIVLVLTQPDRPAGRGMKLQASAVKQYAEKIGAPVAQPRSLRLDGKYPQDAEAARQAIQAAQANVMVVAAYGLILPEDMVAPTLPAARGSLPPEGAQPGLGRPGAGFKTPTPPSAEELSAAGPSQSTRAPTGGSAVHEVTSVGAINIHGSLLPRWRGAAPIHRAIEAGDTETGVTIMQMDAGLDTGDILAMQSLPILPDDTTASLHDKVAALGAEMIVQTLAQAASMQGVGRLPSTPQPAEGVTYAHKIEKHEAAIDWTQDAAMIDRRVRAFNPFPGASFSVHGEVIKVWQSQPMPGPAPTAAGAPGTLLAAGPQGLDVATGNGVLRLLELQRPGARRMPVADFVRGFALQPGAMLDGPAPAKP